MKQTVFITGATGFVGSHIARRLVQEGFSVHCIVRENSDTWRIQDILPQVRIHIGDITDFSRLQRIASEIKPDHIFHLANAGLRGGVSLSNGELARVNLFGLMNLLASLQGVDYKSFVNFGSSSEYGYKEAKMSENDSTRPINAYGVTKLAATSHASFVGLTDGRPIVTLRLFSPFGPYDDKERLISSLMLRLLNGEEPALANPSAVRDYIFIDDVVDLSIEAMRKARLAHGEIFNVGSGKEHTILHVVQAVRALMGSEKEVRWEGVMPRPWESQKWEADMGKTFAFFEWRPRYALEDGLHRTTEWFKENKHLYIRRKELSFVPQKTVVPKKISVVVPCYNEEKNIPEMYARLTKVLPDCVADYEIIFVDDASKDGSRILLRTIARNDEHVKAIFFARNFGFSDICYTAGSEHATGDAVVWIDGDIQDPPEMIRAFVEKWREGYDVVYGVRHKRKGVPVLRIGAKFFYRIFNKLSSINMPIDAGDFSLMDRKVIDIINKMPERDRFLRGLRAWAGFKQFGITYVRDERKGGVTTQGLVRYFHAARKGIFSFSLRPLSLITYISVLSFLLLIAAAIFYLFLTIYYPAPRGFLTLLMVVLFIGSIQFLSLAILGEYIGRIFEEVKGRPKYIVEEIVNDRDTSA